MISSIKEFHVLNFIAIKRSSSISILSISVLSISSIVLLGWVLEIKFLLSIFPGAPTMKFNTALLFLFSALGILCQLQKDSVYRKINTVLAFVILLISIPSILQYGLEVDLGIDNLFIRDNFTEFYPGRMSRTTAICFILFGVALLFFDSKKNKLNKLAKSSLGIIAIISMLAVITYILQTFSSVSVLIFKSMAFHTAISFFIISMGLSLTKKKHSYVDLISGVYVGSKLARKLLPFLILLPLILGFTLLYIMGTEAMNTEFGIALYTITYAFFGLLYTSWVSTKLNREDEERQDLETTLYKKNRELQKAIRFKKELVRASPETILIINLNDQNVQYINKDIYPEEGLTRERILGTNLLEIIPYFHPRDREKIVRFHKDILKSHEDDIHEIEIRLKLREDTWEWFNLRGKIFHRRDENWVDEYVILVRNITSYKETQKALINAEKYSILGEVARTLAHELRNPIASIGMATEILDKKLENTEKQDLKNYLKILDRSAKTLNSLVNNLLNTSNYTKPVLEKQDLAEIVDNTLEKAADRIYLAGLDVVKNYDGPYPILADKEKLEIAILNLIVNASEATPTGEGLIEIEILKKDHDIIITITDNGHGLEKDHLDNLFEAFYTTKKNGMGVGLNSVKTILEDHDAKIKVTSKLKFGTSFKISFPRVESN